MTRTPFRIPLSIALALLLPSCTTWRPVSGDAAGFIESMRPDAVLIRTTEGSKIVAHHPIVVDSTVMGSLDTCARLGATTERECDQARVPMAHLSEVGSVEARGMSDLAGDAVSGLLFDMLAAAFSPNVSLAWPSTGPGR